MVFRMLAGSALSEFERDLGGRAHARAALAAQAKRQGPHLRPYPLPGFSCAVRGQADRGTRGNAKLSAAIERMKRRWHALARYRGETQSRRHSREARRAVASPRRCGMYPWRSAPRPSALQRRYSPSPVIGYVSYVQKKRADCVHTKPEPKCSRSSKPLRQSTH